MCSITEIDVATLDRVFAVNVRGVPLCIKHTAPVMLSQDAGSVVNVSSMSGLRGGLSCNIYTASKGAVHALTRSAAAELGEKGIRVNSLSPGAIVTGMFGKAAGIEAPEVDRVASKMDEAYARLQPIPRAGVPDDVAKAAVFLASDGSSFVKWAGSRGRRRVHRGQSTLVIRHGHKSRIVEAPQGGSGSAVTPAGQSHPADRWPPSPVSARVDAEPPGAAPLLTACIAIAPPHAFRHMGLCSTISSSSSTSAPKSHS